MSFGDNLINLFMPPAKGKAEKKEEDVEVIDPRNMDKDNFMDLIDRDSLHSLFPFSWEQYPTYVQSGENFMRVIAIADYPKRVYGNWLSELKRKKGAIDIVQYIDSASNNSMITYYKKTIQNKEAQLLNTFDPYKQKVLKNYIDSANMQLDKYLDNSTTFVYQHMLVYLRANSLTELEDLTDNVKNTLIKLQMKPLVPVKATFQSFWSTMPINENLLGDYTYKESNTEVASSMFPFDDAEILDLKPRSDIEGVNKDTNSLIAIDMLDRNKTLNQNMVVIGTSGVGKTTYMIQKILRYAIQDYQIYIIDPENEYTKIVELLGGAVLHLTSNAKSKINPMQIFSEEILSADEAVTNLDELVKDKIQRLKGFFEVLKDDMSQVEKAVMDNVVKQAYINSGILKYERLNQIKNDQWPTLTNVYDEMAKLAEKDPDKFERVKDFYYILGSYTHGSNTLFDGYTNVNLNAKIVSFDLKPLQSEQEVQAGAYLTTFQYLWDEITKDRHKRKKLFVDEFHFLTLHKSASTFFHQAYKRFRKYNAGAIAGTQQIQDVIEGTTDSGQNIGEAIIGNSFTKVFFGLDGKGVDDVITKLRMTFSEKEKKLLERRRQGDALMIYGSQRAFMNVELTEEELRLIDPEAYQERYNRETPEQPDYQKRVVLTPSEIELLTTTEDKGGVDSE
ncbi:VirB4 family type IV secretion system protein [Leuconostoc mesenteroides]|uniref:VirB4 family type IV secretion system protein n=1 Tax=Leuconostoc mesenteroides TaxID=1245 RepID=UPI0032E00D8B